MNSNKHIAIFLIALTTLFGLAGCSGMTQQDKDTLIGAGVGGVAGSALSGGSGLGTVGGAAVGGVVGHEVGRGK